MESFYGGQEGVSFVLKREYASVAEMKAAFQTGASCTDVWYGEYCIINTPNKNDKTNGTIYRRGLNYKSSSECAIKIGQVVGPSSGTPFFEMLTINGYTDENGKTVEGVVEKSKSAMGDNEYRRYLSTAAEGYSEGQNTSNNLAIKEYSSKNALVPGKDDNGTFHDSIRYTWLNVRKDDADADSWFYVGWEIPYLVNEFQTHSVSQYDINGDYKADTTDITHATATKDGKTVQVDDGHPYYNKWDIAIPKGIKGDVVQKLRIISPDDTQKIYDINKLTFNNGILDVNSVTDSAIYEGFKEDLAKNSGIENDDGPRQIVVYDYTVYDNEQAGQTYTIYIGDLNIIKDLTVAEDGTLTVFYTHDNAKCFTKKIKWIKNIDLTTGVGADGGHFQIDYNNGDASYEKDLLIPLNIDINNSGDITRKYYGTTEKSGKKVLSTSGAEVDVKDGTVVEKNVVRWIDNVTLNTKNYNDDSDNSGVFKIDFNTFRNDATGKVKDNYQTLLTWITNLIINTDGTLTKQFVGKADETTTAAIIKWIDEVELNTDTGVLTVIFNDVNSDGNKRTKSWTLDWVKDIEISDNGTINIIHTTGTETSEFKLKKPTKASVSTDGIISIDYNTGETENLKQADTTTDFHLKQITSVDLNTGISDDKRINVKYNTDTSTTGTYIGSPLNSIEKMVVRPSDWHLFVLFSDPTKRYTPTGENVDASSPKSYVGTDNGIWVNHRTILSFDSSISEYTTASLNGTVCWKDYGTIKDQSGILVGLNVSYETVEKAAKEDSEITDIVSYLNKKYASGLTGAANSVGSISMSGKMVTYQPQPSKDGVQVNKEFYAFNYNTADDVYTEDEDGKRTYTVKESGWYYVGSVADSGTRDVICLTDGQTWTGSDLQDLSTKGFVFAKQNVNYSDDKIPSYWKSDYNANVASPVNETA